MTDLSNDRAIDELADILKQLPKHRVEAFGEWLERTEQEDHGEK